ncbi:hypothetical protein PVT71_13625 [Salipiger sp. H15]|uniref:Uncharacterized protein n=1 Tax=Alloyangia sp. H15 TaxID=3029062 RepID=A0AAU8AF15_9RHOB
MHPLKALRIASAEILSTAGLSVIVGGETREVTVLEHPPADAAVPEELLPAIYCYCRSERIEPDSMRTDKRQVLIDFVLQAQGFEQTALDQVDDMHLEVERALAASGNLGGLVMMIRPVGSEVNVQRGEVVFAARRVSYEATLILPRHDPSVTP